MWESLKPRLKSLAWRAGSVAVVAGLNVISQSLTSLELPTWAVGALGLVLGEVTKWFNNHSNLFGTALKS